MKPLSHIYKAQLSGGAEGYAVVSVARIPEFRTAPPADFDGLGDVWSPNQFLMAAVETCFSSRFRPWRGRPSCLQALGALGRAKLTVSVRTCGKPQARPKHDLREAESHRLCG
jgi:hypothetical protein